MQRDAVRRVALKQELLQRLRPAAQGRQKQRKRRQQSVLDAHRPPVGPQGVYGPSHGRARQGQATAQQRGTKSCKADRHKTNSQASRAGAQPPEPSFQYAGLTYARCWVEPQGPCIPASTHTSRGCRQLLRHQAGSWCLSPARCSLADATGTHSPYPLTCPAPLCNSGQPASCKEARQEHLQEQQYT